MIETYSLIFEKSNVFTQNTELFLAEKWIQRARLESFLTSDFNINEIWESVVEVYENTEEEVLLINSIKQDIPQDRANAIPKYKHISLRNLLYYLSVLRSDANSQFRYMPQYKIDFNIHFFIPLKEGITNIDEWNKYCNKTIKQYDIYGDHFSVFESQYVDKFAKQFSKIFYKSVNYDTNNK